MANEYQKNDKKNMKKKVPKGKVKANAGMAGV